MIKIKFLPVLFLSLLANQSLFPQTTYYVTERSDSGPGSLRNVLSQATAGTTIRFVQSVDTVFLTSGELLIDKSVIIAGNQENTCILRSDTTLQFRIFKIQASDSLSVQFSNLSITGGHAPDGNNSLLNGEGGGGIFVPDSNHVLVLSNCYIYENHAGDGFYKYGVNVTGKGGNGGGIYSLSKIEFYNGQVYHNTAGKGANASSGGSWDSQSAGSGGSGGGIFCLNDLLIENCVFNSNQCGHGGNASGTTYSSGGNGGAGGSGGCIYCKSGLINITNTLMINNGSGKGGYATNSQSSCAGGAAGNGGALCFAESSVTISSSEINDNLTGNGGSGSGNESGHGKNGGYGGGIYALNCDVNITSTEISQNHTGSGGYSGGYTQWVSPGSGGAGGGIYFEKCGFLTENCLFSENLTGNGATAEWYYTGGGHGGSGGGFYVFQAKTNSCISKCRFENNHTGNGGTFKDIEFYTYSPVANGGNGGGLVINTPDSVIRIINCVFSGNVCGNAVFKSAIPPGGDYALPKGGSGGGIYVSQSKNIIISSTVANNKAGSAVIDAHAEKEIIFVPDSVCGNGGGIIPGSDTIEIINSIIADNYLGFDSLRNDIEGIVVMSYSLLSKDTLCTLIGYDNFLNTDPRFLAFPDDLSLTSTSLAVNTGSPDTTGLFLTGTDLAGNPRIYGDKIDMGAYEFQGEPLVQYSFFTYEITMDSVAVGGFVIDSLGVINTGVPSFIINNITTHAPFSVSLDKSNWAFQLEEVAMPGGEPNTSLEIYVKFEGLNCGFHSDSIAISIQDSVTVVDVNGYCKSTEGINEEDHNVAICLNPNPFNQETMITFILENNNDVILDIFDSRGIRKDQQRFKNLLAGKNTIKCKRKNLPAGMYFLKISFGNRTAAGKFVIVDR